MVSDWLKRKLAMISIATANVEKNAFNNQGNMLSDGIGQERKKTTDSLAEALKRGEVTAEVSHLRWRMYKILDHLDGRKTNIIGTETDVNGDEKYITETVAKRKPNMRQYMVDPYDNYPLEIIVSNDKTVMGMTESTQSKEDQTIMVNRDNGMSKINIEYSTAKMNVRDIGGGQKLLEFYVSQYPNIDDAKTKFMIAELERCSNGFNSSILDITGVGFMSLNSTIGVTPNLLYEYDIIGFNKIVKFNGHYIIKFNAVAKVEGENIFEKYRVEELDQKYAQGLAKENKNFYY
jgi:hypothetical protein